MSSTFGNNFKISIFGQSHSEKIGVVIDGLPAGIKINFNELYTFLQRRMPKNTEYSTKRKETDLPAFVSGIVNETTCGAPVCAIIDNTDTKSADYENIRNVPRPGHSDYTAFLKYGINHDIRGGGHFSGRLTSLLCIAGGIAIQILNKKGIFICSHISSIKDIYDDSFNMTNINLYEKLAKSDFPLINDGIKSKMLEEIKLAHNNLDSVGGTIECAVINPPGGIGEPMFDGLENKISQSVFAVPAVKGIEFGSGFKGSLLYGSENNDEFFINNNQIYTKTNNHGGILGGISSGMPIIFKVCIKPTPSIAKPQKSVDLSELSEKTLEIKGRHDPCIVPRAAAAIEAAAAIAVLDLIFEGEKTI